MISITTPTHDPRWMNETLVSLDRQTYQGEWEWIVVPNNGAELPETVTSHSKVQVIPYQGDNGHLGALKRFANEQAQGEIIVELDHDDMLTERALEQIAVAFGDPRVDFVYSNFAEFQDGTYKPNIYDYAHGWQTRRWIYDGHLFQEIRAFPPTAAALSSVHYAPNHVRAWRADAYWDVGGHDSDMAVCDDYDLCCRFYLKKRMQHIDECLYLYRLHGDNSYLVHNAEIQRTTRDVRRKYLHRMVERWAQLNDLPMVDLGAGHGKPDGYIGVDIEPGPGVDEVRDVRYGLPFDENSVGVVRAMDFLEHIPDSVRLMNEIYRVLVDGGWLLSGTPSTDGRGAFQDPTHCAFWNENSFWYYTNKAHASYVSSIRCRFQAMRVETYHPSDFHKRHDIPYVYADLCAVKSDDKRPGRVRI
jgi:SAM-dependent methyltransferase